MIPKDSKELMSVSHAQRVILDHVSPLPAECLPLLEATQSVLASALYADRDLPPFDRVLMDGITYNSAHSPCHKFTLKATHAAGDSLPAPLLPGEAWRVNTGAVLPPDCDTVVPVEHLALSDNETRAQLLSPEQVQAGSFIHRQGSDCQKGELLLPAGSPLQALTVSAAASIGALKVEVIRKPRLFLLTTGAEAVAPDQMPLPSQIRQSHYHGIAAAMQALGFSAPTHLHLPDQPGAIQAALQGATAGPADLIVTCGAISRGTTDHLGAILEELAGRPLIRGVAQRPGKPFSFWQTRRKSPRLMPIFALPGNALSTLVTFHRYVLPAMKKMAGRTSLFSPVQVTHASALTPSALTRFIPARYGGEREVSLLEPQNSGDFSRVLASDGFIELPAGSVSQSVPFYPWH